jgi:hypothetical protein
MFLYMINGCLRISFTYFKPLNKKVKISIYECIHIKYINIYCNITIILCFYCLKEGIAFYIVEDRPVGYDCFRIYNEMNHPFFH